MTVEFLDPDSERRLTRAQLETYDRYLDAIRTHNTYIADAFERGKKEGIKHRIIEIAKKMVLEGMSYQDISTITSLTIEEIDSLK
jgi:predicted transposase/invertase (TIGR01784 family)